MAARKAPTRQQQLDFIAGAVPGAQAAQVKWGVPASVTVAQAILESQWGLSGLARMANNYFGIKARQGDDYVQLNTTEYDPTKETVPAKFRKFASVSDSFDAHGKLLATLDRYRPCMGACDDPLIFAARLRDCGYATDPNYPNELAGLIKQFNLTQFDSTKEKAS